MHQFHFDQQRSRVAQRLSGFLTQAEAEAVRDEVAAACARVRPGSLTMLADLGDYPPQRQEVSRVGAEIAGLVAAASPIAFAVVTASALQRLRLRRVMAAARPRFFETVEDAAADLGWEPAFLAAALRSPDTPLCAAPCPAAAR